MVALKGAAIETYLKRPDPARPIALLFGPDAGLVSERTQALIAASVTDVNDPFGLARLEGDELAADPARLVDEALTVSLFGGRRGIWVKAGSRDCVRAVEALLRVELHDCQIVIEAGDLRRNAPLRSVCERAPTVAVIACYADAERDLVRLIDSELRTEGLSITNDARAALVALLGADRTASRGELRKLTLYARGTSGVDIDDVMAVVADASALALDAIVDAAFTGRPAEVETQWARRRCAKPRNCIAPGLPSRPGSRWEQPLTPSCPRPNFAAARPWRRRSSFGPQRGSSASWISSRPPPSSSAGCQGPAHPWPTHWRSGRCCASRSPPDGRDGAILSGRRAL
jgi:DNA polymerase-3 subunit delta